ncbi:hypothetical protein CHS0354_036697 [Potamilus streckersoni]|uniref:RNB domain-containing protein n=1 Tax=Potamilus streckersoni TaxID=2493646 RepID=A0AAE0WC63_9BIVA|nr:hypothetical protein CHS0354_036697 [Potamilus streckersoni]
MDSPEETQSDKPQNYETEQQSQKKGNKSDIDSSVFEDHTELVCGNSLLSCNNTLLDLGSPILSPHSNLCNNQEFHSGDNKLDITNFKDQFSMDDSILLGEKREKDTTIQADEVVPHSTIRHEESNHVTMDGCADCSNTIGECEFGKQKNESHAECVHLLSPRHEINEQMTRVDGVDSRNNTGTFEGQKQPMEATASSIVRNQEINVGDEVTVYGQDTLLPTMGHAEDNQSENVVDAISLMPISDNENLAFWLTVQEILKQKVAPELDQTLTSSPKQIQSLLEQAKQAISKQEFGLADNVLNKAYLGLVIMANILEDRFVANGHKTCSDLFLKIGKIKPALRSFYRGIKYFNRWNSLVQFRKVMHLWTVFFQIMDSFHCMDEELRSLLEELDQISEDLEQEEKWERCCFVSKSVHTSYMEAERRKLWNENYIRECKKKTVLRMARCTYERKLFPAVNQNCQYVLEELCNYDCTEAMMIWALSLRETKNYYLAREKAERALISCTSEEERRVIQTFLESVQESREQRQSEDNEFAWLQGTNAGKDAEERKRVQEARTRQVKRAKRRRPRRKERSTDCEPHYHETLGSHIEEGNSPSNFDVTETGDTTGATSSDYNINQIETINERFATSAKDHRNGLNNAVSSEKSIPIKVGKNKRKRRNRNLSGKSSRSVGTCGTTTGNLISRQRSISLNIENLEPTDWSDCDDESLIFSSSESIYPGMDVPRENAHIDEQEINALEVSYFETSRMFFNEHTDSCDEEAINMTKMLQEGLRLNEEFLTKNNKSQRPPFYEEELSEQELSRRCREQPSRYKDCIFQIESSHLAYCIPIHQSDSIRKIEISGRSKAGQAFSDDRVCVEILDRGDQRTEEGKAFGKVVKILRRNRKENIKSPVYACTIDDLESHLMKPICKTVPKIHILNKNILKKCPKLKRYRVELYKYDPATEELEFEKWFDIPPEERNNYVFLVVYMGWTKRHIYPRGAVVKILPCAKDLKCGIGLLNIQYEVPEHYLSQTVKRVESVMSRHENCEPTEALQIGRSDLTNLRTFTIDPQGSKDLDDALSVERMESGFRVGVHIADVTAYVHKGDPVDMEAQQRTTTFYSGVSRPHHMMPEPFSENLCSLLPGKCRLSISLFFNISKEAKVIGMPTIQKSIIKSSRRFTYREVQDIINGDKKDSDQDIEQDIHILFRLATAMRKRRLGNSMYALSMELDDETDDDSFTRSIEAHYLVEEFMVLSNKTVAEILIKKFPNLVPLRCQDMPPDGELQSWLKRQAEIVDLLLCLQNRRVSNFKTPSIDTAHENQSQRLIAVQQNIFQVLSSLPSSDAVKFMKTDELHPLQCLALREWYQIQEHAEYRCSGALKNKSTEGRHFSLEMNHYTHFTSPIRRYVDQMVHRLIHRFIDGKTEVYTQKEVEELCVRLNTVAHRAKEYQRNCRSLAIAEKLKEKPSMFFCFIEDVTDRRVTFSTPALKVVHRSFRGLPFNLLDISSKPIIKKDTQTDRDFVTVEWQKRLYNFHGFSSVAKRQMPRIDPNQHVVYIPYKDWVHALLSALKGNTAGVLESFKNITPGLYRVPSSCETAEDVSTETHDSTMLQSHSKFSTTFSYGQVVKIQMTATAQKGILVPSAQLYAMTKNVKCCLQHTEDPVKYLYRYSTRPTMERYQNIKEYLNRWLPLVLMEAATIAMRSEGGFVINNLPVRFSGRKGQFRLHAGFCFERNIEISGRGVYGLAEETEMAGENESDEENTPVSHDWLCIRLTEPVQKDLLNPSSICVAHAEIIKVRKRKERDEISVHFQIHPQSSVPEDVKVERCAVELLMKSDVDRRTEIYLKALDKANELAKRIALNKEIPKLDKDHQRLAKRIMQMEELNVGTLPKNNTKQHEAISKTLGSRFSLIQGPPGTGKSYTGIKLLYLFNKINKWWEQEGNKRKQILFCGPSNKSVDQVARWMINRLEEHCPNIVRMYGRSIEAVEFPIPGKTFLSKRSMRECKAAEDIADISLHHLIRKTGKTYAEEITAYDRKFKQQGYIPNYKEVQAYIHLLKLATVVELKRHDVILCTTAVASNAKLLEGTDIYQIIIDEAAMCPEPQCLVPIIATKAEQVVLIGDHKQLQPIIMCREAAELGLEKSMFERHALCQSRDRNNVQYTLLEIQYRMHPRLCDFPSKEFYDNNLETGHSYYWQEGGWREGINGQPDIWIDRPLKMWSNTNFPHVFCHIEGQEDILTVATEEGNEQSRSNKEEVNQMIKIFTHMVNNELVDSDRINVVSQYNAQCYELREALTKQGFVNFHVNTVVASQGGEWDYVLFSTVRSLPEYMIERNPTLGWCKMNLGFIIDHHQINVALTRARKGLVIVGNRNLLQCDEVWKRLIALYEQRGCVKVAGEFPPKVSRRERRKNRR